MFSVESHVGNSVCTPAAQSGSPSRSSLAKIEQEPRKDILIVVDLHPTETPRHDYHIVRLNYTIDEEKSYNPYIRALFYINSIKMSTSLHSQVVQDLIDAINDDEMTDITLVGQDGASVPANRFVLGARSKVLKRMLYGGFREAKDSKIPFYDYDGVILEAIVEYCCRNEIPKFRLYIHRNEDSARRLVQLFKAADYLELSGLAKLVAQMAHNLMARFPPLACAFFDEADLDTQVYKDALCMIQSRTYVALPHHIETGGGIGCLSDRKLVSVYNDMDVKAGELFLFEMLQQWEKVSDHPDPREVIYTCAESLILENIEPQDLLNVVMKSGYCLEKRIMDAITQQALRASQHR